MFKKIVDFSQVFGYDPFYFSPSCSNNVQHPFWPLYLSSRDITYLQVVLKTINGVSKNFPKVSLRKAQSTVVDETICLEVAESCSRPT